jgi:pimeloyl-ACP methyl ester carboxylesterase
MPKINRDGVEICYEVHGSGPTLLLTHGYSSTSAVWQGQVEALSRHRQLVLWDMRGHGRSDYPHDVTACSEALTVADMAALLDEVGTDDAPYLAASDYTAAKIPGAKKPVIPAAGHAVNIDQPQAFIDVVLPFLDNLPRSAPAESLVQT